MRVGLILAGRQGLVKSTVLLPQNPLKAISPGLLREMGLLLADARVWKVKGTVLLAQNPQGQKRFRPACYRKLFGRVTFAWRGKSQIGRESCREGEEYTEVRS